MFIAFDIGNTNTTIGVYKNDTLLKTLNIKSNTKIKVNSVIKKINDFLKDKNIKKEDINGIGISSVVPALTKIYSSVIKKEFKKNCLIISSSLNTGLKINYDNPKLLGADRICSTVAGYNKYGGPLIVIDLGTATTFNVVSSDGNFLGGVIMPGLKTLSTSLQKQTAKLPKVEIEFPKNVINTNTINSIQTGIVYGTIDSIIGIVNRIQSELLLRENKKAVIIATGGFAEFITKHVDIIQYIEPYLVLDGIKIIYERVSRSRN